MLDLGHAHAYHPATDYEPDTIVVDLDFPELEESEVMQIQLDGRWHRLLPDHSATACGQVFSFRGLISRPEALSGPLCDGDGDARHACFTEFERAHAARRSAGDPPDPDPHQTTSDIRDIRHPDFAHLGPRHIKRRK